MVILIICLCVINITLWLVFLIRFKKLFSTDKIIENTADKMNKFIAEIDRATERDAYLATEATKRIQSKIDEAELKMEMFTQASQRLKNMIGEADRINRLSNQKSPIYQMPAELAGEIYETVDNKSQAALAGNLYQKVGAASKYSRKGFNQGLGFADSDVSELDPDSTYELTNAQKQKTTVTPTGAAYREIPLIITKVLDDSPDNDARSSETRKLSQKEMKRKELIKSVQNLYNNGLDVPQIANQLSCSQTEVQLIIDMNIL
ncbi:MAG: hypothetical protein MJ188_01825 [Treponema sp.]|nr:hypothetical protein [Treponema sp.]